MAGYRQNLSDIYTGITEGKYHASDKKLSDMYREVIAEVVDPNIENDSQDTGYSDIEIDGSQFPRETTVLIKTDGKWLSFRVAGEIVQELEGELERVRDNQNILKRIRAAALEASILSGEEKRKYFADITGKLHDFVIDSAEKTLRYRGEAVDEKGIKDVAGEIMTNINNFIYQKALISHLETQLPSPGETEGSVYDLNLWTVTDKVLEGGSIQFDLEGHPEMRYLMPAGEDQKTRGAAGPGEALISFLYNGTKPNNAGDILLRCPPGKDCPEHSIELKYNQGRIGKSIKAKDVKKLDPKITTITKSDDEAHQFFGGANYANDPDADKKNPIYIFPSPEGQGKEVYRTLRQLNDIIPVFVKSLADPNTETVFKDEESKRTMDALKFNFDEIKNKNGNGVTKDGLKKFMLNVNKPQFQLAKGTFLPGKEESITTKTLDEYIKEYTGITPGKKSVEFKPFGDGLSFNGQTLIKDLLPLVSGNNAQHKLNNLTGAIHLKNYLTHIEKFTWLLVYRDNGDARSLSHDNIVDFDIIKLIENVHARGLQFYYRNDEGGYDLRFL